jgi:serine/threonine-protein kinase
LGAKKDKHVREHQVYAIAPELEETYTRSPRMSADEYRRHATPDPARGQARPTIADILGDETLEAEYRRLTERIGPLAKVIVQRTAGSARTIEEFYAGPVATIPDQADRSHFLAGAPVDLDEAKGERFGDTGSPSGTLSLSEEQLSVVTRRLAEHIGPLARVIVRKAAAGAQDRSELYARLAEHIPSEDQRARFLSTAADDTA